MTSSFTWLDGSERQRRQMRDLLSQFREQGTRDELGLATIRDAFADLLFPGTSALQTRARYFFFVAWMYQEFLRRKVASSEIERRARRYELELIDVLALTGEEGTIGVRARRNLQRLPSNIYWSGLRRLGILTSTLSQEQFNRDFDALTQPRVVRNDDGEVVSGAVYAWHAKLPTAPSSFPGEATFDLTHDEAEFLIDRIRLSASRSFYAWWLTNGLPGTEADFAWHAVNVDALPEYLRRELLHARNFSESMHGASVLYSLLLTKLRKQETQSDALVAMFDKWHDRFRMQREDLSRWDLGDFWHAAADAGGRIGPNTRSFVETWIELAIVASSAASLRESDAACALIERREASLKAGLARFSNARALELWGGSSGLNQIDYRWSKAVAMGLDMSSTAVGSAHDQ